MAMSALGHKQTFEAVWEMSALPPKADIHRLISGHATTLSCSSMRRRSSINLLEL